mgnify:CR=1 FL=1
MSQIISFDNKDLITTPFPKVISVLNDAKRFISSVSMPAQRLINDISWIIKIIQNHSLYVFDFTDNEKIEELQKDNSDFKEFIDFVCEYNEQVKELRKKNAEVLSKSTKISNDLGLSSDPSLQIKKIPGFGNQSYSFKKTVPKYTSHPIKVGYRLAKRNIKNPGDGLPFKIANQQFSPSPKGCLQITIDMNKRNNQEYGYNGFHPSSSFPYKSPNPSKHISWNSSKELSYNSLRNCLSREKIEKVSLFNSIQSQLGKCGYDVKKILTKEFNIFELKDIIGYENVLPIVGKTILEGLGVTNETLCFDRLESFLKTISDSYFKTTLYHNSLHGSDVTHTCCQIFLNSNARKILDLSELDVMEIIIGALGHDTGHPGLTNGFQTNAQTEMALTYNDISCLENFHVSKLFTIAKKPENDIFEKLENKDFKTLRKRMISMILATDMANHGKIMANIKAKTNFGEEEEKTHQNTSDDPNDVFLNRKTAELFTDKDNKFENQQTFLDYFIHAADLAHNTKLFKFSLKWVELLSNEFWKQGDKEKSMKLPVSFLCDREDTNVPKSQVGFLKFMIIPTFKPLINMFPTLSYMNENADKISALSNLSSSIKNSTEE